MTKKIIGLSLLLIFGTSLPCLAALDWKAIHAEADQTSIDQAQAALSAEPDSLAALYRLGLVYLNDYNHDAAEKVFRRMLELDISSIEAQWGVAECLRRRHEYEISARAFSDIIKTHPGFAPAYISYSYIKFIWRDFEGAAELAYTVMHMPKDSVDVTNMVRALGFYGGAKGAVAHYGGPVAKIANGRRILPALRRAQRLAPDSAVTLFGLGSYYLLVPRIFGRDIAQAESYLQRALAADPRFVETSVRLAQLYQLKGDDTKYQESLARALALDPRNELARDLREGTCRYVCVRATDD